MANKITVKLSFNDDLRRLTVDSAAFTFAQLKETVKRLYTSIPAADAQRLVVKYLDDEEDLVTISSDEELAEAINLSRTKQPPVLRLYLKEAPKVAEEENHCGRQEGSPCHGRGFGRPWWARRGGCPAQPGQPGQARRCPVFQQEAPQPQQNVADLPKTRRDDRHPHELTLTTTPYGHGHFVCDGCQLAGQGASYQCTQCQFDLHLNCTKAKDVANPWERRQQWFRLHQEAMKALETKTRDGLEKARELLKEQANTSPFHRVTPLYNLACVEALLGDKLEKAIEYLQEAVAAGWTDVDHIKNDSDLNSLRDLDAYKALVASLEADSSSDEEIHIEVNFADRQARKEAKRQAREEWRQAKQQAREEKKEEKKVEREEKKAEKEAEKKAPLAPVAPVSLPAVVQVVPAPVAPVVPAPSPAVAPSLSGSNSVDEFQTKLKTLEDMGFADRRRNITALVLARGDLVAAVQSLLGQ